jgi:BASS family bile acid:Na+ symporter
LEFFEQYPHYEHLFARLQLTFFMLGMGANLILGDFAVVLRQPRALAIGVLCQFVLSPLLALVISRLGDLQAGIAVGLILASLMPGGAMSKLFTYLGRGNVALSITLTLTTTLGTLFIIPLMLKILAARHVPEDFAVPPELVIPEVSLFLILPLIVGMTVGRLAPERRKTFSRWCIRIGLVFVILMVTGSLGSGRIDPWDYGWEAPLAIILFCLLVQQASMAPFYLLRWPRPDRLSIGIEVTMRNMNLALLLKALLFPAEQGDDPIGDGVLFVTLYYAAVAMIAGFLLTLNHQRLYRQDTARAVKEG